MARRETAEGTGRFVSGVLRVGLRDTSEAAQVVATAAGIKSRLRRLCDQEKTELLALDVEQADLDRRRKEVMARAWARGHVVTLQEVTARVTGGY